MDYLERQPPIEQKGKRSLTPETTEWAPDLDTELAIDGQDIPGFKAWINWNDADIDRSGYRKGYHQGVDFAAYLTTDDEIVLGLPPDTPVRAVADGKINTIAATPDAGYNGWILVEHGKPDCKMESIYRHVVAKEGLKGHTEIKKGDVIGTLYVDKPREGNSGRLVHLHLEMTDGGESPADARMSKFEEKLVSPLTILDPSVRKFTATPQQSTNFKVEGLDNRPMRIANFDNLLLGERSPKE